LDLLVQRGGSGERDQASVDADAHALVNLVL
jgi:hypothetical protein